MLNIFEARAGRNIHPIAPLSRALPQCVMSEGLMASPVYPDESKKRKLNNAAESIISNRRGKSASLEIPVTRIEQVIKYVFERDVKDAKLRGLLYMKLNDAFEGRVFAVGAKPGASETISKYISTWVPAKPVITQLLIAAFESTSPVLNKANAAERVVFSHPTVDGRSISKFSCRRAAEWVTVYRATELSRSGELTETQLTDERRKLLALVYAATGLASYLHLSAKKLAADANETVYIQVHSTDDSFCGPSGRGSGLVFCDKAKVFILRAIASTRK